ncbi:unnamed protein product [Parnassius apollo]|uniref:(apollo) hypothetical protein n=1 Tax=Parnassius apollo TaxID=110799 RepID=A0A8S3XKR8_PARAO|nr:unnamed protein product [Parnassius apollo]
MQTKIRNRLLALCSLQLPHAPSVHVPHLPVRRAAARRGGTGHGAAWCTVATRSVSARGPPASAPCCGAEKRNRSWRCMVYCYHTLCPVHVPHLPVRRAAARRTGTGHGAACCILLPHALSVHVPHLPVRRAAARRTEQVVALRW